MGADDGDDDDDLIHPQYATVEVQLNLFCTTAFFSSLKPMIMRAKYKIARYWLAFIERADLVCQANSIGESERLARVSLSRSCL